MLDRLHFYDMSDIAKRIIEEYEEFFRICNDEETDDKSKTEKPQKVKVENVTDNARICKNCKFYYADKKDCSLLNRMAPSLHLVMCPEGYCQQYEKYYRPKDYDTVKNAVIEILNATMNMGARYVRVCAATSGTQIMIFDETCKKNMFTIFDVKSVKMLMKALEILGVKDKHKSDELYYVKFAIDKIIDELLKMER